MPSHFDSTLVGIWLTGHNHTGLQIHTLPYDRCKRLVAQLETVMEKCDSALITTFRFKPEPSTVVVQVPGGKKNWWNTALAWRVRSSL